MCGLCGEQVDYYIRALGKGEFMFFFFDLLFSFSSFLICLRLTVFLCANFSMAHVALPLRSLWRTHWRGDLLWEGRQTLLCEGSQGIVFAQVREMVSLFLFCFVLSFVQKKYVFKSSIFVFTVVIRLTEWWSHSRSCRTIQIATAVPFVRRELRVPVSSPWDLLITQIASTAECVASDLERTHLIFSLRWVAKMAGVVVFVGCVFFVFFLFLFLLLNPFSFFSFFFSTQLNRPSPIASSTSMRREERFAMNASSPSRLVRCVGWKTRRIICSTSNAFSVRPWLEMERIASQETGFLCVLIATTTASEIPLASNSKCVPQEKKEKETKKKEKKTKRKKKKKVLLGCSLQTQKPCHWMYGIYMARSLLLHPSFPCVFCQKEEEKRSETHTSQKNNWRFVPSFFTAQATTVTLFTLYSSPSHLKAASVSMNVHTSSQ